MEIPDSTQPDSHLEPTFRQTERNAKLVSFNRRFVYLPIGVLVFLIAAVILWLLIISLSTLDAEILTTLSAVADAFVILAIIPTLLICGLVPGLAIALFVEARRREMAPIGQTQRLFWRLEGLLGMLQVRTQRFAGYIVRPFIDIRAFTAFIKSWLRAIRNLLPWS